MEPQTIHAVLFWVVAVLTGICAIGVVVTQNIVRSATWLLFALAGTSAVFFLLGADFVGATQLLIYVGGTLVLVVFGVMLTAQGPFVNLRTGAAEWAFTAVVGITLFAVLTITTLNFHVKNDRFRITRATIEQLKEDKVPDSVIEKLTPMKDAVFENEKEYVEYLERTLGKDDAGRYQAALTTHAQWNNQPSALMTDPSGSLNSAVIGESFLGIKEATPEAKLSGLKGGKVPERTQVSYLLPFEIVSIHLLVVLIGAAYLARAKRRRGAALP